LTRARILLADDNKEMRDTIERLLESEFDIVGVVSNGAELVEAESTTQADICLVDISMPIMSGFEAAHQMKTSASQIRIIFLTVHDDPDLLHAALETGALGYVLKSRIGSDLSLAIRSALSGQLFISPSPTLGTVN